MNIKNPERIVLAVAALLMIINLFAFSQSIELRAEEGRRALISIEMVESGNYLVPTLHDHPYYNKPPLYNWIIAAFIHLLNNSSEWVIRLPGLISLVITALILFQFSRRYLDKTKAGLLALAYLSTGDLLFYGSVNAGEIDLFYSMIVVLQVAVIHRYVDENKPWHVFIASYVLVAIGFLTKGFPSLLFQFFTLAAASYTYKRWKLMIHPSHVVGIVVMVLLCGGYFIVYSRNQDALAYLINIFQQASQRTISEHTWRASLLGVLNFPLLIFSKTMPWSLFLLFIQPLTIKERFTSAKPILFITLFIVLNLWIYWLSPGVKIRYLYMFFPFLCVFYFQLLPEKGENRLWLMFRNITLFSVTALGLALVTVPWVPAFETSLHFLKGWNSIFIAFGMMLLSGLMFRLKSVGPFIALFILTLSWCRMGYNVLVLPEVHRNQQFSSYAAKIGRLAGIDEVAVIGTYALNPKLSLFGHLFVERQLAVPLEMPYQVPYYYYQQTGKIMKHHDSRKLNAVYFTMSTQTRKTDIILDESQSIYKPNTMVLFRPVVRED